MEGSLEFLDAEGEWHFDPATRELYVVPPAGVASGLDSKVFLSQTDALFTFVGSTSEARRPCLGLALALVCRLGSLHVGVAGVCVADRIQTFFCL